MTKGFVECFDFIIKLFCSRHLSKEIELIFEMILNIFWQSVFPSPLKLKTEKS